MGNEITPLPINLSGGIGSSIAAIAGGATGGILSSVIGDIASVIPFVGPIIQAITSFIGISGGCGEACIASAKGEQVFEVAGDDITHIVMNGMLSGTDGVAILGIIKNQGEQFLTKLIEQGDTKAQNGLRNMDSVINNLLSVVQTYGDATTKLDLNLAKNSYISTSNQGWYVESVVSGNALATQILQAYVQAGITGAQSADLSGTVDTILSALSSELTSAQNTASSTESGILGGIAGLLGLAQAGSTDTGTKVISGILGEIGLSSNTATGIASDISAALSDVTKLVNEFQTDVVGKLINPVLKSISDATTLQGALEADLKNGLTGILQIPSQLAGYLSSQAAISKQAVDLTNENRTSVASTILAPEIGGKISGSLDILHETVKTILGAPAQPVEEFSPLPFTESLEQETFKHDVDVFKKFIETFSVFGVNPIKGLLSAIQYVLYWSAAWGNEIRLVEQAANIALPVEPLNPETVVELLHRNLISHTDAILESNKTGLDASRLNSLYVLKQLLLSPQEAIDAFYRGLIDEAALKQEFDYFKYDNGRRDVLLELSQFLPDVGTAASWFARDFITPEQFIQLLKQNHWTSDEIDIAQQALFTPANSSEYTRFKARADAAQRGFLAESYTSNPPDDVNKVHRENQQSQDQARLDWLAHWRELGIFDYVNAYYRGLIDENVYNEALGSLNLPPELNKLVTDVNRPLIPFFYLTEMLAAGIFNEQEARELLSQYGFNEQAITASIKFGNFKAIGKATDQNTALAQLSVSTLKTMFNDAVINKTQLIEALQEHGYNSEVAILLADLYETEQNLKANNDYANGLVARVKLGQITKLQALDALAARGFTQDQLAKYDLQIEEIKVTEAKLPSLANFNDFWKKGLISDDDYLKGLELIGYNQQYSTLFLNLLKV